MDDTHPVECLATSNAHINIKYTAMKGIPRLVPIDKPVEGMQVVYSGFIERIEIVGGIGNEDGIHLEYFDAGDWCEPSELKQIVIEYNIYDGDGDDKIGVDTLPLHSEDYQACINKIGEEIEFETFNISQGDGLSGKPLVQVAKLILPKQDERTYTRQDMENAYKEGCRVASPFGDQGLSKYEKQHWPTWIENYKD